MRRFLTILALLFVFTTASAQMENSIIIDQKTTIDSVLSANGFIEFSSGYWSSTEYNYSYNFVYYVSFSNGDAYTNSKNPTHSVRAVYSFGDTPEVEPEPTPENCKIGDILTVNGVQGIVFQTSPVKIVSVLETSAAWSTENVTTGATNADDGSVNVATIKAISGWESKYPAFKWCADLGEGWYLPAYNELVTIYNQKATLNSVLEVQNLAKFSGNWHWSSTEYNYNYACCVIFSNGNVLYSNNKNSKTIVRAVYSF